MRELWSEFEVQKKQEKKAKGTGVTGAFSRVTLP
jgi:hypothetical protein